MEVKKLEHVDSTVVANGVVAMGCNSDCKHFTGNISTLFNCEIYTDQSISDDF